MTKADLRAEVFRRLNESASTPVFWSVADVDTALAEGYAEISDAAELYEASITFDLQNDRPYYDLRTLIGSAFLAIKQAFDPQTNRWLLPTSVRQFDAHDRRWERVDGEPQRLVVRGLWWLGLWPRIQSDTGQITQYYTALPPALAGDEDEPGFPESFHYGLVEFALTDLWAQDGETARALAAWQAYLAQEADLIAWVGHRVGDPLRMGMSGAVAG